MRDPLLAFAEHAAGSAGRGGHALVLGVATAALVVGAAVAGGAVWWENEANAACNRLRAESSRAACHADLDARVAAGAPWLAALVVVAALVALGALAFEVALLALAGRRRARREEALARRSQAERLLAEGRLDPPDHDEVNGWARRVLEGRVGAHRAADAATALGATFVAMPLVASGLAAVLASQAREVGVPVSWALTPSLVAAAASLAVVGASYLHARRRRRALAGELASVEARWRVMLATARDRAR